MNQFLVVCKDCALFNGSGFYLAYGLLVLGASITKFRPPSQSSVDGIPIEQQKYAPVRGELAEAFAFKISVSSHVLHAAMHFLFSFESFNYVVHRTVRFIRVAFMMGDNPSWMVSFKRYFILYYVVVTLPAAFLTPVAHLQRKPDLQLLAAALLLIVLNALGDVISVRLTLRNVEKLKFEETNHLDNPTAEFWQGIRNELTYYLAVLKGSAYPLVVLVVVLALSSVLYGVQIGELDIAFSMKFLAGAWDRMLRFPELAFQLYWIRGQPGPFGTSGIPGLFLYGVVSFIPVIILFSLALAWLVLLPLRMAVNLPLGKFQRLVVSELSVIFVCVLVSYTLHFNPLTLYSFLIHT